MDNLNEVRLGDLAYEVSERVANPSESGYERFVGLEHLDSGSLYVNRWGSTSDVKSSMKLFKKGDILFARRNTYLKRASVADFDGVCSGDIIVLREYDTTIKGITLLIMNLEKFWDFTISNSAGTMSKRAKWRDISEFKVVLKSKEYQEDIVKTMITNEEYLQKKKLLLEKSNTYKDKFIKEIFIQENKLSTTKTRKICEIAQVTMGQSPPSSSYNEIGEGIPFYQGKAEFGKKYPQTKKWCTSPKKIGLKLDILMSVRAPVGELNIAKEDCCIGRGLCALRGKDSIETEYLYYLMQGNRHILASIGQGSTFTAISSNDILNLNVKVHDEDERIIILNTLRKLDKFIDDIEVNINYLVNVKKVLLNRFIKSN